MQLNKLAFATAMALAAPVAAMAQESALPQVTLSGFGTLARVSTDTNDAEYATSVLQPGGAKKKGTFGVDSLVGGQLDVKFSESISAALQAVANRNADDNYQPHIEWGFVRYALTPDLSIRGGVMAAPVFMLSDSRLVGLTYPWVRTPTALYSQVPLTNFRGVDLSYRHNVGPVSVSVQPYMGEAPTKVPEATLGGHSTAQLEKIRGVNAGLEMGSWSARVGYFQTRFTYDSPQTTPLFAGLRQIDAFVPGSAALAASLEPFDKKISFASAGIAYDGGNLLVQAEYGKRKTELFLADTSAWYGTVAYRIGNFTPHITLSQVKTDSPTSQSVVPAVGPTAALGIGVNTLLGGSDPAQKAIAVGVRYQLAKSADLKLQWDRIDLPSGSVGNFTKAQPGFAGSRVNGYSIAVDFVF